MINGINRARPRYRSPSQLQKHNAAPSNDDDCYVRDPQKRQRGARHRPKEVDAASLPTGR